MRLKFDRSKISLILILSLSLGLIFRLSDLDQKVFWVDEVATVLRAAGYTKQEVIANLADGTIHSPAELLSYQKLHPDRTLSDAIAAFQTSPEHAPLYFLLIRLWMQVWGSSVVAIRSFSVVCSLLLLPAMYRLSQWVFNSVRVSQWTVVLTALSPFFVAYAQEARPYSFWLLVLVLSSIALLQALRKNRRQDWVLYALTLTVSFYTSLLSLSVAIAQAIYVLIIHLQNKQKNRLRRFSWAFGIAAVAMLPWLSLIQTQWSTLQSNTSWMRLPLDYLAKGMVWFYSIAIVYFDVPVVTYPIWLGLLEIGVGMIVVSIVVRAFYVLGRELRPMGWFVLALAIPVPLVLIAIDLISNGRYSTAPRYMLPFQLGTQLAVAYLLSDRLNSPQSSQKRIWQGVAGIIIVLSLISNLVHLHTSPRYLKNRNLSNAAIASLINRADQPLLLSEADSTIDLLSLSRSLKPDTKIQIFPEPNFDESTDSVFSAISQIKTCDDLFLLNPSFELKQRLKYSSPFSLEQRYSFHRLKSTEFSLSLWQLNRNSAC